jgi:hypothetical protein
MGLETGGNRMSAGRVVDQSKKWKGEAALARKALKWMMEHKVYYDPRHRELMQPDGLAGRRPFAMPPEDVAVYLFDLSHEVDLQAEHVKS